MFLGYLSRFETNVRDKARFDSVAAYRSIRSRFIAAIPRQSGRHWFGNLDVTEDITEYTRTSRNPNLTIPVRKADALGHAHSGEILDIRNRN